MIWQSTDFQYHEQNCGNTPESLQDFLTALFTVSSLGYDVLPGYGTLLGLYRDGKLIDHDTDVDVMVKSKYPLQEHDKQIIINVMVDRGFKFFKDDWPSQLCFTKHNDLVIDIAFLIYDGKDWVQKHELGEFRFSDEAMSNPEKFFMEFYGPDWRTPINTDYRKGTGVRSKE